MISITFEAHSTTYDNEHKIASGWADVPLSPLGEAQARELGERYSSTDFDAVFCSDLQRSYGTAQIAFGDRFHIIQDRRLRECNYGKLTRQPMSVIDELKVSAINTPFPEGESFRETSNRMKNFLEELERSYAGKNVLIIGHRATQYGLDEHIRALPLEAAVTATWHWQPGWSYSIS